MNAHHRKGYGRRTSLALLLGAAGLWACGGSQQQAATAEMVIPPNAIRSTDDIVEVLHTANAGEIQTGQLAQQKASNERVRQFAERMIRDHSEADRMLMQAHSNGNGNANHARSSDHPVSQDLQRSVQQTMTSLQARSGAEFDRAYIDSQIQMHTWTLDTLEQDMIPAVESGSMRDARLEETLEDIRDQVREHLRMARQIQTSLGTR